MKYLVLIALVLCFVTTAQSLLCRPCTAADLHQCTPPSQLQCRGGLAYSACSCCPECGKLEGEGCGGFMGQKGSCEKGLICDITEICRKPGDNYIGVA
jgi:hypothetical protein